MPPPLSVSFPCVTLSRKASPQGWDAVSKVDCLVTEGMDKHQVSESVWTPLWIPSMVQVRLLPQLKAAELARTLPPLHGLFF